MQYQKFIQAVSQYQTKKIRALSIPTSSSPESVPESFIDLLPEVIHILERHFHELADTKSMIGIFGLQSIGFTLQPEVSPISPRYCVLYLLPTNSLSINSWANFITIVIDCQKGLVVDQEHYIHEVLHHDKAGKVYGKVKAKKLAALRKQLSLAIAI